jgi:hypothetical protein
MELHGCCPVCTKGALACLPLPCLLTTDDYLQPTARLLLNCRWVLRAQHPAPPGEVGAVPAAALIKAAAQGSAAVCTGSWLGVPTPAESRLTSNVQVQHRAL